VAERRRPLNDNFVMRGPRCCLAAHVTGVSTPEVPACTRRHGWICMCVTAWTRVSPV